MTKKEKQRDEYLRNKICNGCKIEKSLNDFYPRKCGGVISECKVCTAARRRAGYLKRGEMHRKTASTWYKNNKDWVKGRLLKNKYWPDLTWQEAFSEYNNLRIKQNHACAICYKPEKDMKVSLAVDHCHRTKIIRGLLCSLCNHRICAYIDRKAHSKERPRTELEMAEQVYQYYKGAYNVS